MRKAIILGLAAALFVVVSQAPSQAAGRVRSGRVFNGNGVFSRLMEIERAKNQWLFNR